jgi:hypothetical protein
MMDTNPVMDSGLDAGVLGQGQMESEFREFLKMQKDLAAGLPVPAYDGGGSGFPLMFHSVQGTLASTVFTEKHIRFWPTVPKARENLINTVHEYSRQTSRGDEMDFFASEGGIGPLVDSAFERLYAKCKFMSHTRRVSHVMSLINPLIGGKNALEVANVDASRWTLRNLERMNFFGNEATNPAAFTGLLWSIVNRQPGNVTDAKGSFADTAAIYSAVVSLIQDHWGSPTKIWMDYNAKADFGLEYLPYVKYDMNPAQTMGAKVHGGLEALGLNGPDGVLGFEPDAFLKPVPLPASLAAIAPTGQTPPAAPTYAVQPDGSVTDAASVFETGDAGTYYYYVRAVGSNGCGLSQIVKSNAVVVAAGKKVTFTITAPGSDNVVYYEIYRCKPGGSSYWKILEVRQTYSQGVVANTVVTDLNEWRPDTTCMFIVQPDIDIYVWQQLLPFTRIPFPMTEQSGLRIPQVYAMYGMLEVQVPEKLWVIKNVGRAS